MNILIVEDEASIREEMTRFLEQQRYTVESVGNYVSADEKLELYGYDCMIVDVMLPDGNGIDLIRKAKRLGLMTGVIVVSACGATEEKIAGLESGADDYIAKPFSVREVLARVRSVLRRTAEAPAERETIAFEGLEMDLRRKVCTLDGKELPLTKKEFEILALLLTHRGVIFSREEMLRRIWSDEVIVLDRTVDVNITRLRRKIGPYGEHIVTRLGYGYGFEE